MKEDLNLTTAKDFGKGFDQADGYLSMLGVDILLMDFTSKHSSYLPRDPKKNAPI